MPEVTTQKKSLSRKRQILGDDALASSTGQWIATSIEWSIDNVKGATSKKKVTILVEDISATPVSRSFLIANSISVGNTKKGSLNVPFQSGSICIIYEDEGALLATDRQQAIPGLYVSSVDIRWVPQNGGGPDAWELTTGSAHL